MSKRVNMFPRSTIPHICRGPHVSRMCVVLLWAPPTLHTILMIELDGGIFSFSQQKQIVKDCHSKFQSWSWDAYIIRGQSEDYLSI